MLIAPPPPPSGAPRRHPVLGSLRRRYGHIGFPVVAFSGGNLYRPIGLGVRTSPLSPRGQGRARLDRAVVGIVSNFARNRWVFLYCSRALLRIEPDAPQHAQEIPRDLIRLVSDRGEFDLSCTIQLIFREARNFGKPTARQGNRVGRKGGALLGI